ncbi:MAG: hypothetical protein C0402_08710 [Thermodesulfovibrio sp.]|nr:hypothetical protein [Thermodesulfovibrio sp.]
MMNTDRLYENEKWHGRLTINHSLIYLAYGPMYIRQDLYSDLRSSNIFVLFTSIRQNRIAGNRLASLSILKICDQGGMR